MLRLVLISLLLTASLAALSYEIEIDGVEGSLKQELQSASILYNRSERAPKSFPALQYRAEADVGRLLDLLHSKGYYGAHVGTRFVRAEVPRVTLRVEPGPLYPLVSYEVGGEGSYPFEVVEPADLGLCLGRPARAEEVLEAEQVLLSHMHGCGWPLARIEGRDVIVDRTAETVEVTVTVDSGPFCTFGPLNIKGLRKTRRRFVTQCLPWRRGQRYDPCKVDDLIDLMRESGLFRSIRVTHAAEALPGGQLPVTVALEERKPRTIGLGMSYGIDQGFGPELLWEHRNFFGMGETLGVIATTGNREQEATLYFRRPHFLRCRQDLLLSLKGALENKPAYYAESITATALLDRVLNDYWAYSYGVEFEQVKTRRTTNDGDFSLISTPINIRWTRVADILDPTQGFRVHYEVQPTLSLVEAQTDPEGSVHGFVKQQIWGFVYYPLTRRRSIVLAGWGTLGSIAGASLDNIPATQRFYAGSDSTLRGYRYQRVGPIAPNGKPTGGRSIMVWGVESRFRFNQNWGAAVFYESGNVFRSQLPRFDQKLLHSVGFGPRYFTGIGPISVDIAFPLNRRRVRAHHFEVYVNIGQPF